MKFVGFFPCFFNLNQSVTDRINQCSKHGNNGEYTCGCWPFSARPQAQSCLFNTTPPLKNRSTNTFSSRLTSKATRDADVFTSSLGNQSFYQTHELAIFLRFPSQLSSFHLLVETSNLTWMIHTPPCTMLRWSWVHLTRGVHMPLHASSPRITAPFVHHWMTYDGVWKGQKPTTRWVSSRLVNSSWYSIMTPVQSSYD